MMGKIENYFDSKGYGFIRADNGDNIFLHFWALAYAGIEPPYKGRTVEFSLQHDPGHPGRFRACQVRAVG